MKVFRFILVCILLSGISNSSFSQNKTIDSLKTALANAKHDTTRVIVYERLAWEVSFTDLVKGLEFGMTGLNLARKINFERGEGAILNTNGTIYWDMGDYTEALNSFSMAIRKLEKTKSTRLLAVTYSNLGGLYSSQKEPAKAKANYQKGIELFMELGAYSNLSTTFNNMGSVYFDEEKYDSAQYWYTRALKLNRESVKPIQIANNHLNLSMLYLEEKKYDLSGKHLDTSEMIYKEANSDYYFISFYLYKGTYQWEALHSDEAIASLLKSLNYAKIIGVKSKQREVYKMLAEIYEEKRNYAKAFEFQKLFSVMNDSILNEEKIQQSKLAEARYKSEKQMEEIQNLNREKELLEKNQRLLTLEAEHEKAGNDRNKIVIIFISALALLLILFSIVFYNRYKIKQRTNNELQLKNEIIEVKNKEITDSIHYAKRIQYALLAQEELLSKHLRNNKTSDFFVLFTPKDIVSGDFYLATESSQTDSFFVAVCDSTGHGVPGAFMSLLNGAYLNEAINEKNIVQPGEIFNHVRRRLISTISKEDQQDGMDGIILKITKGKLEYAAANNSPYLIRNNEITELSADKMPIGKSPKEELPFRTFQSELKPGDLLYFCTDGYADQFGGDSGKKFKSSQLKSLLLSIHTKPMDEQKQILFDTFEKWKSSLEQVDDVCIIGIRC